MAVANRQMICDVLLEAAKTDRSIVVLCSDSRGSGSMTAFAEQFPEQFIETGIAEQNLVGIAAGLAKCGKKAFAVSPASFLSTRSYEQCKVDVAYSRTNVKLIGISGGISYGALGMSHHSLQDIAAMSAIPGMRVYLPSDAALTRALLEAVVQDEKPAYIRVSRNPSPVVYGERCPNFALDRAVTLRSGTDAAIFACGELVAPSLAAAELLAQAGISAAVVDLYCIKPIDRETILRVAGGVRAVVTAEEHAPYGGMGSMVSQILAENCPRPMRVLSLPDEPVITGTPQEVFDYYGLNAAGIANAVKEALRCAM